MARPSRVYNQNPGDFTETIEHKLLMCSNVIGNNNKFYSLEIQKSKNDTYQLFSHYGRISGDTINDGVYEVRYFPNEYDAKKEFNGIIKKKIRGKTKKSSDGSPYKESYREVEVISSSVGSSNVVSKKSKNASKKNSIDTKLFEDFGKVESNLLKMLEEENIHEITSVTTMTYTADGLQTPLGPLTYNHLDKARKVLDNISNEVKKMKANVSSSLTTLNNEYLSLIPRNLGRSIASNSIISSGDKVLTEYNLLNQMETAIKLADMKDTDEEETKLDLGFNIQLASKEIHDEVRRQIDKTRKHRHLERYKVKRVFQIENYKERKTFESYADSLMDKKGSSKKGSKLDYAEVDMFHGSRNSNILSILMNGFYVPPSNAPHVTGRMFGNGVYGADASTKALNYSAGGWGGRENKNPSIFCFVVLFSLGKVYETKRSLQSGVPSGYDSIFASGGADLLNNEYIVPKTAQTTMKYLVEFE